MVNSVKAAICFVLAVFSVFSFTSCKNSNQQTSKSETPTSAVPTTQPATEATVDEPVTENVKYNHNKIKQNSDIIKSNFDGIVAEKDFKGGIYVKIGNDFEYIETDGFSNLDTHTDNSVNTCYRVGSVTKQFTAAAIMLLQEQGKLKTSDTLEKFYPSYKHAKHITIKNLLNMTSGIPDYMCMDGSVDSFFISQTQLGYQVDEKNSAEKNKTAILNWIFAQSLNFAPGTDYQFSNSGYYILGDIIEKASGVSYEKFVEENIINALELSSTGFTENSSLAKGYDDITEYNWILYPGVAYSSSGLISNIPDLLVWAESFSESLLLSEESVKEMTDIENGEYGYGFFLSENNLSQNGRIDRFGSNMVFSKNGETIFIVLSNYASSDVVDIYSEFNRSLKPYIN